MVEMTCEEHDKLAASSQFITHTVGRMLGRMELPDTPINTRGYESLLSLVRNTTNDSFDLYYGLFMYNEVRGVSWAIWLAAPAAELRRLAQNATEELARMEAAFDMVKRQLFDQLHDVVRQRIFYVRCAGLAPFGCAASDASWAPQAPPEGALGAPANGNGRGEAPAASEATDAARGR